MYLSDFRPVSFEQDGSPIIVTAGGLVQGTGAIISAVSTYGLGETIDRTTHITDITTNLNSVTDAEMTQLFKDGTDVVTVTLNDNSIERFIKFTFVDLQRLTAIKTRTKSFDPPYTMSFYGSTDNINWVFLTVVNFGNDDTDDSTPIENTMAFKYFKLSTSTASTNGGTLRYITFDVADAPAYTTVLPNLADGIISTTIDNNTQGVYSFESASLLGKDVHNNGVVEFKIDGIPAISFNADRTITDANDVTTTGNPGNTHFNGFMSSSNSFFCGGGITTNTDIVSDQKVVGLSYIQGVNWLASGDDGSRSGTEIAGMIKFRDKDNSTWIDLAYVGAGLTARDGTNYGEGLYIENRDTTGYDSVITSENIGLATTPKSGLTASRPATTVIGEFYFDTDLNKPVWFNGNVWVDATGATV